MTYQPPQYPQQPRRPPIVPGAPQYPPQPPPQYGPPPAWGAPPAFPPQFPPPPKRKPSGRRVVLIVTLCVLGVCGVGVVAVVSSSVDKATVTPPAVASKAAAKTAAKPKQPDTYNVPLGSTITITGDDGSTADGVIRSVKTYTKACDEFSPDPDNGVFVVVDVIVEQTKGSGSVNPLDFTFVADDGTTANATSGLFSGCDKPGLDSTNSLHAGQKRAGKVAFDATSGKGTVEWAPGGFGADSVGSWKVG